MSEPQTHQIRSTRTRFLGITLFVAVCGLLVLWWYPRSGARRFAFVESWGDAYAEATPQDMRSSNDTVVTSYFDRLASAAVAQTKSTVIYDPAYVKIPYPNGDVDAGKGVCADVIIRAYRALGADLQELLHKDIAKNFSAYPKIWGLKGPDTNIDHRRVPNLMTFFKRSDSAVPVPESEEAYRNGDVVAWDLGGGITHIGIVVRTEAETAGKPFVVHNIGAGPKLEDVLFNWKILGVFRYAKL